jgi:hypothetical protein
MISSLRYLSKYTYTETKMQVPENKPGTGKDGRSFLLKEESRKDPACGGTGCGKGKNN